MSLLRTNCCSDPIANDFRLTSPQQGQSRQLLSLGRRLASEQPRGMQKDKIHKRKPEKTQKVLTATKKTDSTRSRNLELQIQQRVTEELERRKKLEQSPDAAVEKAKEGLVQCLRVNDRRPLDCWEQVEAFKTEVAKLEQKFVDRALS